MTSLTFLSVTATYVCTYVHPEKTQRLNVLSNSVCGNDVTNLVSHPALRS